MKKIYSKVTVLLFSLLAVTSCTKFEDLELDTNSATSVPPSMLLAGILKDISEDPSPWDDEFRDSQFWVISFDYYGDQDYNWGSASFKYNKLANIVAMEEEASKLSSVNKYGAIAKFLKAYYYDYMTKRMGDIPMLEALQAKGEEAISTPKYDSQQQVYEQILTWLEEANTQIAEAINEVGTANLDGDFFYEGDLTKWQKAINAFHLRVLVTLSSHNSEMNVASRFKTIVENPSKYPLFESIDDNMKRVYGNETNNFYEWNPGNYGFNRNRNIIGATYLDLLKANEDPRIYVVADPAAALYDENDPKNLDAYVGANTGDEQGPMQVASDNGELSYPSEERYYSTYSGEPFIVLGYAEQEFAIAEAANRGWITEDAATHYQNGIMASMEFYGVAQSDIDTFMADPEVAYKGGADGLNQILTQKYIAFFNNSGLEAYFNYRRTGVPTFDIGPANKNGGKIPVRWKYPQDEYQNNAENVNAALSVQFGGSDDINSKMWLIK